MVEGNVITMISVTVSYTVQPQFVEENKKNIEKFLDDFKELDGSKFTYSIFLKDDGVTFVHSSHYSDADIQQQVLNVPSFLEFQKRRDASGLNGSHKVEVLSPIGSSKPIL